MEDGLLILAAVAKRLPRLGGVDRRDREQEVEAAGDLGQLMIYMAGGANEAPSPQGAVVDRRGQAGGGDDAA